MRIYVVQYEEGGIPNEPQLFSTKEAALECEQDFMVDQGYRRCKEGEDYDAYLEEYHLLLSYDGGAELRAQYPNFETDDTVRVWDVELDSTE